MSITELVNNYRPDLSQYEELYKYLHANPELSNLEKETAALIAKRLKEISSDFDVRPNIGGHGIAALLFNGEGPTVLLRADFDALPVKEATGLPYASTKRMVDVDGVEKPVMHACGHDMHVTCLLAAAHTLVNSRASWSGTLLLAFQPAEERGTGAQAMVDDGLYTKHKVPKPDVAIGAHVVPWRSGTLGTRRGSIATSADSFKITLHGRGGHASQPHNLIDPVVMAAHTIIRLQTIASRETDPNDVCVVTVASVQAGDAENVVVDDVTLSVDTRSMNQKTRDRTLASIRRIVEAESAASNAVAPPDFKVTRSFPLTINDEAVTEKLETSFRDHFTEDEHGYRAHCDKLCGSEDFSILGTSVGAPTCFFLYGGVDPETWDRYEKEGSIHEKIPINHSKLFAPVIRPTMDTGVDGYVIAALSHLQLK